MSNQESEKISQQAKFKDLDIERQKRIIALDYESSLLAAELIAPVTGKSMQDILISVQEESKDYADKLSDSEIKEAIANLDSF